MGIDVVTGFQASDTIQLRATDFATWSVLQNHMTQQGADTVITFDASDTVTLKGVTMTTLTSGEFVLK